MKKSLSLFAASLLALFLAATSLNAAPMTNADVIKLVKADLDEAVIITSIENAESGFDTTANGLIALKEAKVSKPIVNAIIKRASTVTSSTVASANNSNAQSVNEVIMIDNGVSTMLTYSKPETRQGQRGMGWGGVAAYCVLKGPKAATRASSGASFVLAIPQHASADGYLTLAWFETRKNNTREVMIGNGGWGSVSTGIPKARVVAVKIEKQADQSKAPADHAICTVTPVQPMKAGEYAFIIGEKCFDFGIDK